MGLFGEKHTELMFPDEQKKWSEYIETPHQGWKDSTIEHPDIPKGGRGFESYIKIFELDPNELRDKVVLDLGAGPEAKLDHDLREQSITTKTISLSPDYSIEKSQRKIVTKNPDVRPVAGLGQALPFAEKSIDTILALHVHEHLASVEIENSLLKEMARVLKPGGQAHVGPAWLSDSAVESLKNDQDLLNYFAQLKVTMSIRQIPKEVISFRQRIDTASANLELTPAPYDITLRRE